MGFSKDIKIEILENLSKDACCKEAFLSAIIKTGAEYGINGSKLTVNIKTQLEFLFPIIKDIANNFDVNVDLQKNEECFFNKKRYQIVLSGKNVQKMLMHMGIAHINQENYFDFYQGLNLQDIDNICCKKQFIKGAFISCGSASGIDEMSNKSIDYHIEWVFVSKEKAEEFTSLLNEIQVNGRIVKRKKLYVVYLQKFEDISDMLVLFDAQENMLKLNSEYAKRSIMNSVNRQANCDTANMTKTIDKALEQLSAIELIKETIGLETLGEELSSICMLRLANAEESLKELSIVSGMSKSAINYRLNKVLRIAKEIREEQS